jgi:hypothetical protein
MRGRSGRGLLRGRSVCGASAPGGRREQGFPRSGRRPAGEDLGGAQGPGEDRVRRRAHPRRRTTDSAADAAVPRGVAPLRRGSLCRVGSQPHGCSRHETRPAGRDTARVSGRSRRKPRVRGSRAWRATRCGVAKRVQIPAGGVVSGALVAPEDVRDRTRPGSAEGERKPQVRPAAGPSRSRAGAIRRGCRGVKVAGSCELDSEGECNPVGGQNPSRQALGGSAPVGKTSRSEREAARWSVEGRGGFVEPNRRYRPRHRDSEREDNSTGGRAARRWFASGAGRVAFGWPGR